MRRLPQLILLFFILGTLIFIYNESLPSEFIFLTMILSLIFVFSKKYKFISILAISLLIGILISHLKFNSFLLNKYNGNKNYAEILIIEKVKKEDFFQYEGYVHKYENNYIKEKVIFVSKNNYNISDYVKSEVKVEIPSKNTNPGLFNYRNYLISKNITSKLTEIKNHKVISDFSKIYTIKRVFKDYIKKIFYSNLNKKNAEFVLNVLIGEKLYDLTNIQNLGLSHIMVVSGLHVDLLLTLMTLIGEIFSFDYKKIKIFSIVLAFFYSFILGFSFSIIRVIIMNLIDFIGFLTQKPSDKINKLSSTCFIMLLINPFSFFNAGFILSFMCVFSIFVVYEKFLKILKIEKNFYKSVVLTFSVELTLFPFIVFYFNKINFLSLLANIVVVPIFTISLYMMFLILFLYPFLGILITPIFTILDFFIFIIDFVVELFSKIDLLNFEFQPINVILLVISVSIILTIIRMKKSTKKGNIFFIISTSILIIFIMNWKYFEPVSFSMIDIGQGDAFILQNKNRTYLFDVGGSNYSKFNSGKNIMIPVLKYMGVSKIDAIFISHSDIDHSGNLKIIKKNFKVEKIFVNKYENNNFKSYKKVHSLQEGDKLKLSKDITIKVVSALNTIESNDRSLGLLIKIGNSKILTLGDLSSNYEDELNIKADILKVSHHGSKNSTSKKFLNNVKPKIALISAGKNNTYGHPSKQVLKNLKGIDVYNTQSDGFVKIIFKNGRYKVEKYIEGGFFK
ncbi:MAG: DNA internalization-related competence protein ComEC/Rec2 [Peptoniphilaceae bacterium]|nr:DNA internalization-related competence protein ComEC/Rec2 [Peptoniphilaceae bacterium]MDD7383777.1 DNA internalization-related competence protein ComEC/Rec2 [Peptoniphilaceae bacterium]MDY3738105.1 DNA internalization-related competence protein ComEC/Rec2 [Peptoniphilaceae bacterium]